MYEDTPPHVLGIDSTSFFFVDAPPPPPKFYHRVMYIAPSSGHEPLNIIFLLNRF